MLLCHSPWNAPPSACHHWNRMRSFETVLQPTSRLERLMEPWRDFRGGRGLRGISGRGPGLLRSCLSMRRSTRSPSKGKFLEVCFYEVPPQAFPSGSLPWWRLTVGVSLVGVWNGRGYGIAIFGGSELSNFGAWILGDQHPSPDVKTSSRKFG